MALNLIATEYPISGATVLTTFVPDGQALGGNSLDQIVTLVPSSFSSDLSSLEDAELALLAAAFFCFPFPPPMSLPLLDLLRLDDAPEDFRDRALQRPFLTTTSHNMG